MLSILIRCMRHLTFRILSKVFVYIHQGATASDITSCFLRESPKRADSAGITFPATKRLTVDAAALPLSDYNGPQKIVCMICNPSMCTSVATLSSREQAAAIVQQTHGGHSLKRRTVTMAAALNGAWTGAFLVGCIEFDRLYKIWKKIGLYCKKTFFKNTLIDIRAQQHHRMSGGQIAPKS